jgi:hypothetical protein
VSTCRHAKFGTGKQVVFIGGITGAFMVELEWPRNGEDLTGILLGLGLAAFVKKRGNNERNAMVGSSVLGLDSL